MSAFESTSQWFELLGSGEEKGEKDGVQRGLGWDVYLKVGVLCLWWWWHSEPLASCHQYEMPPE
jgi:hypothetical protein